MKIEEVEAAILLVTARRLLRNSQAPKLGPIRSLHYFAAVIEEIKSARVSELSGVSAPEISGHRHDGLTG